MAKEIYIQDKSCQGERELTDGCNHRELNCMKDPMSEYGWYQIIEVIYCLYIFPYFWELYNIITYRNCPFIYIIRFYLSVLLEIPYKESFWWWAYNIKYVKESSYSHSDEEYQVQLWRKMLGKNVEISGLQQASKWAYEISSL